VRKFPRGARGRCVNEKSINERERERDRSDPYLPSSSIYAGLRGYLNLSRHSRAIWKGNWRNRINSVQPSGEHT